MGTVFTRSTRAAVSSEVVSLCTLHVYWEQCGTMADYCDTYVPFVHVVYACRVSSENLTLVSSAVLGSSLC